MPKKIVAIKTVLHQSEIVLQSFLDNGFLDADHAEALLDVLQTLRRVYTKEQLHGPNTILVKDDTIEALNDAEDSY
jgi:hypothetical protein